jgi:hypothetical protein
MLFEDFMGFIVLKILGRWKCCDEEEKIGKRERREMCGIFSIKIKHWVAKVFPNALGVLGNNGVG